MGDYAVMFALLEIERTARGLPKLQAIEYFDPVEGAGGYIRGDNPNHRHLPLNDIAPHFADLMKWLNERQISLNHEQKLSADDEQRLYEGTRSLQFALGGHWRNHESLAVEIVEENQLPLTAEQRKHWVIACITFSTERKGILTLPESHPAHDTMLLLLDALQPIKAFVTLESVAPSVPSDASYIHRLCANVDQMTSCFLGPELVKRIPTDRLTMETGLARVVQVGQGVWVTVPGGYGYLGGPHVDEETVKRHREALDQLMPFMPPTSPFDPAAW